MGTGLSRRCSVKAPEWEPRVEEATTVAAGGLGQGKKRHFPNLLYLEMNKIIGVVSYDK